MSRTNSSGRAHAAWVASLSLVAIMGLTQVAEAVDVTVLVKDGAMTQRYAAPWADRMTVLDALQQALPTSPDGSFSLKYFPAYDGYIVSAVSGKPIQGSNQYWSTCLLPSGPGSTEFSLPLSPNRVILGPNDTVSLVFNGSCGSGHTDH